MIQADHNAYREAKDGDGGRRERIDAFYTQYETKFNASIASYREKISAPHKRLRMFCVILNSGNQEACLYRGLRSLHR